MKKIILITMAFFWAFASCKKEKDITPTPTVPKDTIAQPQVVLATSQSIVYFGDTVKVNVTVKNLDNKGIYLKSDPSFQKDIICYKDTVITYIAKTTNTFSASLSWYGGEIGNKLQIPVTDKYPEKTRLLTQKPWHLKTYYQVWSNGSIILKHLVTYSFILDGVKIPLDSIRAASFIYDEKEYYYANNTYKSTIGDTLDFGSGGWVFQDNSYIKFFKKPLSPANVNTSFDTVSAGEYKIEVLNEDSFVYSTYKTYSDDDGTSDTYKNRSVYIH